MTRKHYWINTMGVPCILMDTTHSEPVEWFSIMYGVKETSQLKYLIFKYTRINLEADDKLYWLRGYLKSKWQRN